MPLYPSMQTIGGQARLATADQTGVNPNNSSVKILLNSLQAGVSDSGAGWDLANSRYIAPRAGKYWLSGSILLASTNVLNNTYQARAVINGSTNINLGQSLPAASTTFAVGGSGTMYDLAVGDTVELSLFGTGDNSASTLTVTQNQLTRLSIFMLFGQNT